jgi:hypothetical protein
MNLSEIYTEGFYANPKSPDFVEKLEKVSDYFKVELPKGINKKRFLTFVSLMLDPNSELRKNIPSLPQRKTLAALCAGFTLDKDNRFPKEVEDVLLGSDPNAARIMGEYCMLSQGIDFLVYTAYVRIFSDVVAMSFNPDKAKDSVTLISKIKSEIDSIEQKIFAGDETDKMRKSLYLSSKSISLNIQPEDIVDRISRGDDLSDMNPYGDYKPNKLTYAGEDSPEDQQIR